MVISASLIAAALVLNAAGNFLEFNITLWGQTISMTALFGITGYSMATLLGLWLVISILKSGKL
jgi:ubiquinone biosynthesis protein